MVASFDCKTATETVPLVCRRWKRVQKTMCGNVVLHMISGKYDHHIGCSLEVALQRFKSVTGLKYSKAFKSRDYNYIRDSELTLIAQNCKSLTNLDLYGCEEITDSGLIAIAENCKSLTYLELTHCDQVTDAGFSAIAENCKSLTDLILRTASNEQVTDAGIIAIAENCKSLTNLILNTDGNEQVTCWYHCH